jgi:hypothetical protein
MRQLEEQNKVVAFWEDWIKTVSSTKDLDPWVEAKTETQIGVVMHEARLALADAGREVLYIYRGHELEDLAEFGVRFKDFQSYRRRLPWYRRLFLLYKAPNRRAELYRIMFHANLSAPFIIAPVEIPILNHLRNVGLIPPPPLHSVHDPFLQLILRLFITLLGLGFWLGTGAYLRQRSRAFEKKKEYYVMDKHDERIRGIKPA